MKKNTRITKNEIILNDFFLNNTVDRKHIPTLSEISRITGVDASVVSRYAKKKGFYNFSELRTTFNKSIDISQEGALDKGFLDFLRNHQSFSIITSKSTIILGIYIKERLSALGIRANILPLISTYYDAEEAFQFEKDDAVIITTLSSDSDRTTKFISQNKINQIFYITTENIQASQDNLKLCILNEYKYLKRDSYEIFRSIRKIMDWLDIVMNVYHIEVINQLKNE